MNLTAVFIKRHVATVLLTLGLCAAGLISYRLLPVSSLPQVDFPTISVTASLPGASPTTMAASVATPLERAIGSIAGITEMTSFSTLGSTRITIQFDLDRDINGAARDVQAAINAALTNLPANLPNNPTYRLVNPANAPIMLLALTSDTLRPEQLYDIASSLLSQKISQIDGIGEVDVGGGSLPAVRIQVNTDQLHQYGFSLDQISNTIQTYNSNRPQGAVESGSQYWQITTSSRAYTAAEFAPLIISTSGNTAARLSDIATVTDSVQDVHNAGMFNGKTAVMIVIYRKPGANVIAAVDAVKAALPQFQAMIPAAVNIEKVFDSTTTIRASLHEITMTLFIAVALVILIVFLFLGNIRATLIPGIAIAVSLIATFAGMYLLGYSLDNLSLMALAVATGFVVDDAIVVLENISRYIENGLTPLEAALTGAKEVSFTVLSISISLIAVFIPILFMKGIVGRLFREFAVTLSLAIGFSLILSLTLTPMLCAYLLSGKKKQADANPPNQDKNRLQKQLERFHARILEKYVQSLGWVLRHQRLVLCIWIITVATTVFLYVVTPKGFFPEQDTGLIRGSLLADESISFQALRRKLELLMRLAQSDPAVETVAGFTGSTSSTAFVLITLKPKKERYANAEQVIARLRSKMNSEPGAQLFMLAAQDINVGGRLARALYQYTLRGNNLDELQIWTEKIQQALQADPIFKDLNNDLQNNGLKSAVMVDRDTATRLGTTMEQIDNALNNAFGQAQISTMYRERNQYRVVMVTEDRHWQGPDGLHSVYVPAANGTVIPLRALASFTPGKTPIRVNHQGQTPAATISFNLAPGASLSQATERIRAAEKAIAMPHSIEATFQGTAKEFEESLTNQPLLILTAILCLYIVLGVLYESTMHPITILSTLPPAGIGAMLALHLFGMDFSIIALIGILLLAGIVKKNGILLIDFALDARRNSHVTPEESIVRACELRFRPIMMTTMAALLGAVPIAIGFGDGSELRRPLGISIIGGLTLSQILTLYTTPVLYLYLDRLGTWWHGKITGFAGKWLRRLQKLRGAAP